VVWALNDHFVVVREPRECLCPEDFVAGLVMPRSRVTGIEDPNRPEGIWQFAWDTALTQIAEKQGIGLAINPIKARSQNQMHVHIQKITHTTRGWFDSSGRRREAESKYGLKFIDLQDLAGVFAAVEAVVGASHMGSSGVLVVRSKSGGYQALITHNSSPEKFVHKTCK